MVRTLQFLCRMVRASHVLVIGGFTGQASLGIAEAIPPSGRVVMLEREPFLVELARRELRQSHRAAQVSVLCGDAVDLMRTLPIHDDGDRFPLIFMDGCKSKYSDYLEVILERDLLTPGGIIVIDDTLWKGGVYHPEHLDTPGQGPRRRVHPWPARLPDKEVAQQLAGLSERIARDERLESLLLPICNGITLIHRASSDDLQTADVFHSGLQHQQRAWPSALPGGAAQVMPQPLAAHCSKQRTAAVGAVEPFRQLGTSALQRQHSAPARVAGSAAAALRPWQDPPLVGSWALSRQTSAPSPGRGRGRTGAATPSTCGGPSSRNLSCESLGSGGGSVHDSSFVRQASQASGRSSCATPQHLWPATPDSSPRLKASARAPVVLADPMYLPEPAATVAGRSTFELFAP